MHPSYKLKISRARMHIEDISQRIENFLKRNPYTAYIDKTQASKLSYCVKINHEIPEEWSFIIGDAIHNTRSSLDHLMMEVTRRVTDKIPNIRDVSFLISKDEKSFEKLLKQKMNWLPTEIKDVIRSLKPYKEKGTVDLYNLHQLDILDKHQALIPVGGAYTGLGFPIETFNYHIELSPAYAPFGGIIRTSPRPPRIVNVLLDRSKRIFPLHDKQEIFFNPFKSKVDDQYKFEFGVLFGEGQYVDGEPVAETLKKFADVAEEAIATIEKNILSK